VPQFSERTIQLLHGTYSAFRLSGVPQEERDENFSARRKAAQVMFGDLRGSDGIKLDQVDTFLKDGHCDSRGAGTSRLLDRSNMLWVAPSSTQSALGKKRRDSSSPKKIRRSLFRSKFSYSASSDPVKKDKITVGDLKTSRTRSGSKKTSKTANAPEQAFSEIPPSDLRVDPQTESKVKAQDLKESPLGLSVSFDLHKTFKTADSQGEMNNNVSTNKGTGKEGRFTFTSPQVKMDISELAASSAPESSEILEGVKELNNASDESPGLGEQDVESTSFVESNATDWDEIISKYHSETALPILKLGDTSFDKFNELDRLEKIVYEQHEILAKAWAKASVSKN